MKSQNNWDYSLATDVFAEALDWMMIVVFVNCVQNIRAVGPVAFTARNEKFQHQCQAMGVVSSCDRN